MVGAARFERATSCSQGTRSNQAELCPEPDAEKFRTIFGIWQGGGKNWK